MSHYYCVHCSKCHESSDSFNRADSMLIQAVKESFPLYLLSKTGWSSNLWNLGYEYLSQGLASFIVNHYECKSFEIHGEYSTDPVIKVEPDEPVCLELGAYI